MSKKGNIYQWDLNKTVSFKLTERVDAVEAHFAHPDDLDALVVRTKKEDEEFIATIPNILLQSKKHIRVWLVNNGQTIYTTLLRVIPRSRPSDYVYTETEVLRYESLEKRIEDLEKRESCAGAIDGVLYIEQKLTVEQRAQARENIGAADAGNVDKISKDVEELKKSGIGGGITKEELNGAVNEALVKAKESGEFNGSDGEDGKNGTDGKTAYQYAQDGGYVGTKEEFAKKLAQENPTKEKFEEEIGKLSREIADLNIKATSPILATCGYKGKKVLILGDSISTGSPETTRETAWIKHFREIIEPSKLVNVATSGAKWTESIDTEYDGNPVSGNNSNNVIGNQVEKIIRGKDSLHPNYAKVEDYENFDLIIISAGTNDGVPNGDFESSFVSNNAIVPLSSLDKKVFASAVRYAVETLQTLYPNATVFICTPIQACFDRRSFSDTKAKRNYLIELCERMSVPYIDSFMCGISAMFEVKDSNGRDLEDGLHPNENGAKKLGIFNATNIVNYYSAFTVYAELEPVESYTNQVPISIDTDGSVFNGVGWIGGKRVSSSGELKDATYATTFGYMPVKAGDIIRFKDSGNSMSWEDSDSNSCILYADSDFGYLGSFTEKPTGYGICTGANAITITPDSNGVYMFTVQNNSDIAYLRMSIGMKNSSNGGDIIITINEEITD